MTVEINNREQLSRVMNTVLAFSEILNAKAAQRSRRAETLGRVLRETAQALERSEIPAEASLLSALARDGFPIDPAPDVVDALLRQLRRMNPQTPAKLERHLWAYALDGQYWFATQRLPRSFVGQVNKVNVTVLEEVVDPIALGIEFLHSSIGLREGLENHYIQEWLRFQFGLSYDKDTKYALARVSRVLNQLLYKTENPTRRDLATTRNETFCVRLLLDEIRRALLPEPIEARRDPARTTSTPARELWEAAWRQAAGIFLFLRFCRLIRVGHWWVEPDEADATRQRWNRQPEKTRRRREQTTSGERDLLGEADRAREWVIGLRPVEYMFLQARMFGGLYAIRGLNGLFRGGLLPHTSRGRTILLRGAPGSGKTVMALQMMADVASRGRLGVYLSLEEPDDAIVDRLVTFGLLNPERFVLVIAKDDEVAERIKAETMRQARSGERRGLLVLCGYSKGKDLVDAVSEIAEAAGAAASWRAVAIDSVNAFVFGRYEKQSLDAARQAYRETMRELVQGIESEGFLGVLIAEQTDRRLETLPYLVDTDIELRSEGPLAAKCLEIHKSRAQPFHGGRHRFRLSERSGFTIYPSLSAIRSRLRRRVPATLSDQWSIPLPEPIATGLRLPSIAEKSSVMLLGQAASGKTALALNLATAPRSRAGDTQLNPVGGLAYYSFRTPEVKLAQLLRRHPGLQSRWDRITSKCVRWFAPGVNLSGAQIVGEVWRDLARARRRGEEIERIVFDGIELAESLVPGLREDPLFWPTLHELVSTEAVTAMFVATLETEKGKAVSMIEDAVDYRFFVERLDGANSELLLRVECQPALVVVPATECEFSIQQDGSIVGTGHREQNRSQS